MIEKVLFLWPPQLFFYGSLFKHFNYFGETVDYIDKNTDCEIRVMDAGVELFHIKKYIENFKWCNKIIIYTEFYTIESSLKISKLAKQTNKEVNILAYGPSACYIPKFLLENGCFDAIVPTGHWESSIKDFIEDLIDIDNRGIIMSKKGISGIEKKISSKSWGRPDNKLISVSQYFKIKGKKQLEITVNKGCPYPCSFCIEKTLFGNKDYRRDTDDIITFINETRNTCDTYYFNATTFTLDKEWVIDLCNKIIDLPYKIKWRSVTRLDALDEDLICLMNKAGCYKLSIGIETLNSFVQNKIGKKIDKEFMIKQFMKLEKHNIIPRALLIIGLPDQKDEDIIETYNLLERYKVEIRSKEYCPYNELNDESLTMKDVQKLDRTNFFQSHSDKVVQTNDYLKKAFLEKDI